MTSTNHNTKEARLRQYRGQRRIVLNQWENRVELIEDYSDHTLYKLAKTHGLNPIEMSRGEVVFAILEREYPMPDLRRFGLTPDDVRDGRPEVV